MTTITATEATRMFSDLLNKVHYQGKTYEIKRGRDVIAKIGPAQTAGKGFAVSELNAFFANLPALDEEERVQLKKTLKEVRSKIKAEKDPWD